MTLTGRLSILAGAMTAIAALYAVLYLLRVEDWRIFLLIGLAAMLPFYVRIKRVPRR